MNDKPKISIASRALSLNVAFWFLLCITVAVSIQQYLLADRHFWDAMRPQYNNYLIFKYSFSHLINGLDLYSFYPEDHGDYFKYSPSFALFMGLFYFLPDWLGLLLWNFLNVIILFFGIRLLPQIDDKNKFFIFIFILLELIGNLQNEQSNALMTGLILLTFVSFERKHLLLAALFVSLGIYLKIFGVVAAALFLLYPDKKKFILYLVGWIVILWALPLLIVTPTELVEQYKSWGMILLSDHESRYGFSILGILHKWFGFEPDKLIVIVTGVVLFCLGYLNIKSSSSTAYRLLFLSSILIWVVLFNHTAESSGYILAMTGCGIWFFSQQRTLARTILFISTFVIVSLFSTDLMPAEIRNSYIYPFYIRTLPILIIWIFTLYDMLSFKTNIKS